jgi:hypothetical protein
MKARYPRLYFVSVLWPFYPAVTLESRKDRTYFITRERKLPPSPQPNIHTPKKRNRRARQQ